MGEKERVDESFRILGVVFRKKQDRNVTSSPSSSYQIGDAELAYVRITDKSWIKTKALDVNMPRGAILGLQLALMGRMSDPHQVLHTKPWVLPSIRDGLDSGQSFFPHRLQPLPHESDLPPNRNHVSDFNAGLVIPSHVHPFSKVKPFNPSSGHNVCCDGGKS
jgi:hypothetical protein